MAWNKPTDILEFRQNVLRHQERILELSSHELRDSSRRVVKIHSVDEIIEEDSRMSYIQSIENFAYILVPYFDKEAQKVFDSCIKIITAFNFEMPKVLKKSYKRICVDRSNTNRKEILAFSIAMKIKYAKKLFIELNKLLFRNDYLKSQIFGESLGDEVVEDES